LAVAGAPGTAPQVAATIVSTARDAFLDGWAVSMWVGVGMAVAALLFVIARGPADDAGRTHASASPEGLDVDGVMVTT
jgi:hypothetical protein